MNHGLRILAAAASVALAPRFADASDVVGATFLAFPLSVRQAGMGEVTLGRSDVMGGWVNPALLADVKGRGELALSGARLFDGEAGTIGVGFGWRLGSRWTAGLLGQSYSVAVTEIDELGNTLTADVGRTAFAGAVSLAYRHPWFEAGASFMGLTDRLDEGHAATTTADLGVAGAYAGLRAAVAVRNLGGSLRTDTLEGARWDERLPFEVRTAVSYTYRPWHGTLAVDYAWVRYREGRIGVGLEYWPAPSVGLRCGVNAFSPQEMPLTFGLSYEFRHAALDYAFSAHQLGGSHRVGLSYRIGS